MARKTEQADQIDRHIGLRIREHRENIGMTQGDLARAAGVSYQQIHKYEQGTNRISAGRLGLIAQIFETSVAAFYAGATHPSQNETDARSRLCMEVARNFRQITNTRHQEALHYLVRMLVPESPIQ